MTSAHTENARRVSDMADMCGDNRFEIIAKAKEHLLDATNIDTSPKEMEVLDDFLFRCWQMGWLDRYDRKDEPQNYCDDCLYTDTCDSKEFFYACTSKATISKMEQVEDEPQTDCDHKCIQTEIGCEKTDCPWK